MKTNIHKGFTLIELLVVIAIIGILSAVVMVSLNTARTKGSDAAVQADLDGIRTQAQLYYNTNANYGPVLGTVESNCGATDNIFSETTIQSQVVAADGANGVGAVVCNVSADGMEYAVSAELMATPGTYYCIDSTGAGKVTGAALAATATGC